MFNHNQRYCLIVVIVLLTITTLISRHVQAQACPPPKLNSKFECLEEIVVIGYCKVKVIRCGYTVTHLNGRTLNLSEMRSQKTDTISPMGIVIDDKTGKPIPDATVSWIGSKLVYKTDEKGEFEMCVGPAGINKLEISSIGYETDTVDTPLVGYYAIYRLKQTYKELKAVTIVGYPPIVCGRTIACVAPVTQNAIFANIKQKLPALSQNESIKLFPNPIALGSQFFCQLNNNETGNYKVEIIDASGKIIQTEQVSIVFKKQTISLSTSAHWAKGMYWMRIAGRENNSSYTGNLIIR